MRAQLVVATPGITEAPGDRSILALGEAEAGETVGVPHLRKLEAARASLGTRAADARLLLFGSSFSAGLRTAAARRHDVVLVDLERLYHGSQAASGAGDHEWGSGPHEWYNARACSIAKGDPPASDLAPHLAPAAPGGAEAGRRRS